MEVNTIIQAQLKENSRKIEEILMLNQKLVKECNEMKVGQQTEENKLRKSKPWRPNISAASFEPSGKQFTTDQQRDQRANRQYIQEMIPGMVTGVHRVAVNRPNIFQPLQQPMIYEHIEKEQQSSVYSQFGNHIMETTVVYKSE